MKVLIVEDQPSARHALVRLLTAMPDMETVQTGSLETARAALAVDVFDLALIDLRLTDDPFNRDGLVLLEEICQRTTTTPVVVSGLQDYTELRAAFQIGAADYLLKDGIAELLRPVVERIRERRQLQQEVVDLRARARGQSAPAGMIGGSKAMADLREAIRRVAPREQTVLIHGPTGSGKELVAQAIHALGPRPRAPMLALDCSTVIGDLMESQLFGHQRGAFSGAVHDHAGHMATVADGTLFLDEIAELPLRLQPKLLRVLEARTFLTVGGSTEQRFRGRVVAATHVDLERAVAEGRFRGDLRYRLDVLPLRVPSLDERREDIPALIAHFAARQPHPVRFDDAAVAALAAAPWPGNVRQLRNIVDRLAATVDEELVRGDDVRAALGGEYPPGDTLRRLARQALDQKGGDLLTRFELALIEEALEQTAGNKTQAAKLLGVHRKVIERRMALVPATGDGD